MYRCTKQIVAIFCILLITAASVAPACGQFGGGRAVEAAAEDVPHGEPKSLIAFTVWVLTLADQPEPSLDDESANVAERAANLPPVIGDIDEARQLIDRMRVAGIVRQMRTIRILALDGHEASAEVGATVPRVVATAQSEGRRMNNIRMEPTGTIVRLQPVVDEEQTIQLSLTYETSSTEKSRDVAIMEGPENEATYADVTETWQFESIASLQSGSAVLLHSDALVDSDETSAGDEFKLIILGAEIVGASE